MIIKVCGMRDSENIREVEQLDVDWMGFIFYSESSRCVVDKPSHMPEKAKRVGVFVNESTEKIERVISQYGLDMVQLHGDETPDFCLGLKESEVFKNRRVKVIRSFRIGGSFPSELIASYEGRCDYFLFDTKTKLYGGSGKTFNWTVLSEYHGETPFLLSGGISPGDVEHIKAFSHPKFLGIDINSRFEIAPAYKDKGLIKTFIKNIRS